MTIYPATTAQRKSKNSTLTVESVIIQDMDRRTDLALLRAIKLKQPREALKWMGRVCEEVDAQRVADLLHYSAHTDNLATYLMQKTEIHAKRKMDDVDVSDWAGTVWELAHSLKPYEWQPSQTAYLTVSDLSGAEKDYPTEGLINHLKMALTARASGVYGFTYELFKRGEEGKLGFAAACKEVLEIDFSHSLFVIWSMCEGAARNPKVNEKWGLPYIFLSFIGNDLPNQEPMEYNSLELVQEWDSIKFSGDHPEWAHPKDKRFGESWLSQANMVMMYKEHGKLKPQIQGPIFRTKGGVWEPLIRDTGEGAYQVQSESEPKEFYEVHIGQEKNSCTCPGHVFRGTMCKHIKLIEEREALPFAMP